MNENGMKTLRLHVHDNVIMALTDLSPGLEAEPGVFCLDPIPHGHKVATRDIAAQQPIMKFGQVIGFASNAIRAGEHVHTHNVELLDFFRDYDIGVDVRPTDFVPEENLASFMGIERPDGRIATRNYIGLLSM